VAGHAGTAGAAGAGAAGAAGGAGATGTGGAAGNGGASGAPGGHAGGAGAGAPGGQSGAAGGRGGASGQGGDVGIGSGGAGGIATCQLMNVPFVPRAPTVMILVDRGGYVTGLPTADIYTNVRSAVEQVLPSWQTQVRFGLAVYVGIGSGSTCQLDTRLVDPALNNAASIKVEYDSIAALPAGTKPNTPAVEALPVVQGAFQTDTSGGNRFLLFVTTGDTDFCDDGNPDCAADAVTFQLQQMYGGTPSIGARIVGIPLSTTGSEQAVLQNFANAGVGQPAVVPGQTLTPADIYYECTGMTNGGADSWSSLYTSAGRTGVTPLAVYGSPAPAPLYMAASTSAADLASALNSALSSLGHACTYDLSAFEVIPAKAGEGSVTIDGTTIAQSPTDGWNMPSSTELVLNGSACAAAQAATSIKINFPCDALATAN
jgi:hypothetical protein